MYESYVLSFFYKAHQQPYISPSPPSIDRDKRNMMITRSHGLTSNVNEKIIISSYIETK